MSYNNSRNRNVNRRGGHRGYDHHMSEYRNRSIYCGRSPSCSRIHGRITSCYCSCSRIPSKSLSLFVSCSVDAYHITGVDYGHTSPSPSIKSMMDREEAQKVQDRWIKKMFCPKPKTDHQGRVTRYGSW